MSYTATDEQVLELKKFNPGFDKVDVKRGPDRFRMGYHEVCLKGYNTRTLDDLSESLEQNGYRLIRGGPFNLTYCSPDGKTKIYLDEESIVRSEMCKITILRGALTEGQLPVVEQEVIASFYDLE